MRLRLAAVLLLTALADHAPVVADLPAQSDRVVDYTIRARLRPERQEVTAEMDVVWRNTCGAPVEELYVHLYLNAFRDEHSTYLRESGGDGKRGARFDEEFPGWVRVEKMALPDGTNIWTDAFVAPDDGNEKDATLARVALPSPVAPGETISLQVAFRSRLPRVLHRTGWSGDPNHPDDLFFMVAQWFPKIAVVRAGPDGAPRWNAHQFHRNTEFFSDYAVYRVSLTVPKNFTVGATGVRQGPARDNGDGTKTVVHHQADVHDFAWTASPHLEAHEFAWEFDAFLADAPEAMAESIRGLLARTAEHLGKTPEEIKPKHPVTVRILCPPDHRGRVVDRFHLAAGASLACYGIWFGEYPYDVLTIVDPPAGGRAAGGMEYPTLITVWGDRLAPPFSTGMESVTIHEFGHQYFYGLVGTNEFEEAWLDEGFTSYTDARVFDIAYGPAHLITRYRPFTTGYDLPFDPPSIWAGVRRRLGIGGWLDGLPRPWRDEPESLAPAPDHSPFWAYLRDMPALHGARMKVGAPLRERNWWTSAHTHDAMVMPGWHYAARRDYSVNAYGKPTLFLYCLRGLLGEAAFDRAMHGYAVENRFKHPTSDVFFEAVKAEAPDDRRGMVEAFIDSMAHSAARVDVAILEASQRKVSGRFEWTVRVQRRGQLPLPVTVVATDALGEAVHLGDWDSRGGDTTRTFRTMQDRELAAVRLGPDWIRSIDVDLANNARRVGPPDLRPAVVVAARWTRFAEEIERAYAGASR